MKKSVLLIVAALTGVLAILSQGAPAVAASTGTQIIVRTTASDVHAAAGTGGEVVNRINDTTALVSVPNMTQDQALAYMRSRPDVVYAEPNYEFHAARTTNDPCYIAACVSTTKQWNADKVGLPAAWDITTGRQSVTIATLDSGVDAGHPDLVGHVTQADRNFSTDADNEDDYGHGTHVAGIIAAAADNGIGVAGTDWNVNVLAVKVLNSTGIGTATSISNGIRYAVDKGVRIINMSLGATTYSETLADAVEYAQDRGVLVVAAADNQASTAPSYPGALPGVVAVGASTQSDTRASFSNYGSWVDVMAPGQGIVSTWPRALNPSNPYAVEDGTSMAAPLFSGVAALLWSANPYMTAAGVAERIFDTTDPIQGGTNVATHGRINAAKALTGIPTGYRSVASDGGVFSYGVDFFGSMGGQHLNKPIVSAMTTGSANGYWLVGSDGGVFAFGDAGAFGSTGSIKLNAPIVSSATTRTGSGYWLVASDGGIFSFGDATFFGSMGGQHLNKPIVSVVPTDTGRGYWLIASDGGVFSFGDATFHGSTGGMTLNKPIVGAARTPNGNGYWLVASDGGVFAFGDATFYGSTGAIALNKPIVSMAPTPSGLGYWLTASGGGIFAYGDATFLGSEGGKPLNAPIVTGIS
jgi:subtilisin family serine protease